MISSHFIDVDIYKIQIRKMTQLQILDYDLCRSSTCLNYFASTNAHLGKFFLQNDLY